MVKRQIEAKTAAIPSQSDLIAAYQWVLLRSAQALAERHGYSSAFRGVVERLWFKYLKLLLDRLPFPIAQIFLKDPSLSKPTGTTSAHSGLEGEGHDAASSSSPRNHQRANFTVTERLRAKRQKLRDKSDDDGALAPIIVPTMPLILSILLASSRVARLPLLSADLVQAVR